MGGVKGKPIELLQLTKTKHLTKKEIITRKNGEIKFGNKEMICPEYIKNNLVAYDKWNELIQIYSEVEFLSSGDSGFLARYCKTYAEYIELIEREKRINNLSNESDSIEEYLNDSDEFDYRIRKQLMDMVSTNAILALGNAINQKSSLLMKMEDHMYLNPLSKTRNVPKQAEEKKPESKFGKFGGVDSVKFGG